MSQARGAGLSRPNVVGARAIGMGGAFTAVADDPTAIWHNPAGIAIYGDTAVYLGGELVITDRMYTPDANSPLGAAGFTKRIQENTAPTAIPIIAASSRFAFGKQPASRFALGLGTYDAYGGAISFRSSDVNHLGVLNTTILDFEVTPTLAYQVTDVLSIGAGVRLGVNSFWVEDVEPAFSGKLSATGVGIGGSFGLMVRPHPVVQLGAVYRTPLSATLSGSGPVTITGSGTSNRDLSLSITWPQSASLGLALSPHRRLLIALQGDWTGWSSVQKLIVEVAGLGPQPRALRFLDSYAVHFGLQCVVTRYLLLRLGWALDSNAVPDRTLRRENQDGLKSTISAGLGLHFWKLFIDLGYEAFLPLPDRIISTPLPSAAAPENETGSYEAYVFTTELSVQIRF